MSAPALRRLIVGYRLSQALAVAAELGIADLLRDGPKTAERLAEESGSHAPSLGRLLRLLVCEGVFAEDDEGRFRLTPLAEPLQSGVPGSLRARAMFDGAKANWRAWGNLIHAVKTGETAFDRTFGLPLFDWLKRHPDDAATFNEVMAEQTAASAESVAGAYDFSGIGTLVDVGGGHGALLSAILARYPTMRGILFDLPETAAGAASRLVAAGVNERARVVEGDFFESVPEGGDAYLLKFILHDWDDARCRTILANCRRAMGTRGRLIAVEMLLAPGNEADYARYLDLNMLVSTGGRERSEEEYRSLYRSSGFALSRVVGTPSGLSLIEGVPFLGPEPYPLPPAP